MIKVESILKWTVEGSLLKKLKLVRSQILSKNPDAVAISDKDLHVTLAAGSGWKKFRSQFKNIDFDEPDFKRTSLLFLGFNRSFFKYFSTK